MQNIKDFLHRDIFGTIDIEKIIVVLLIFFAGLFTIRLIKFSLNRSFQKNANQQTRMLISKVVEYIGFSILLMIILAELGIKLSTLLGAAGILGIAVGVASQKSLGNIISGIFLVTEKSFEIGDVVKVGDKVGVVYSIDLLSIMLKTFDNLLIRIPNETLISTDITNITRFPIRRLDIQILVAYKENLQHVIETLKAIATENTLCLDEPEPFLMIKEFADSGIQIHFGIWFEKSRYVDTKNTMMMDIHNRFKEERIEIPYTHITIVNPL
ncbi:MULTISPECIES: mechanosensitive ion channel family protein [unclassified Oceanispirochaeta]|uniref:mechanosensitive ion channel family protein n=1 Tax=unclassified Oceanispirochaeta TaxID=2635722 RepID=UPI000E093FA4|nr:MULTISPECIES: mechanosensitive ion channel family protein [unclassified Oceanispirochaeta]MBF9016749.1 mechanosensitive ion channel family protein [Oceanispirochaeta sp. M2]NPD72019.1 mechanosensitive ion channel family protein [Oceanispirochaeta sp. M1]RDG32463.1 mechanosensitive ion channel family protein [Oceanispirochaeta sp. M1]